MKKKILTNIKTRKESLIEELIFQHGTEKQKIIARINELLSIERDLGRITKD